MISHRSISRFSVRAGLLNQASRIFGPRSESLPFNINFLSQRYNVFPGSGNSKDQAPTPANAAPNFLGSLGTKLSFLKVNDNASLPSALSFRSDIHSACPKEFDGGRDSRSMNFVRGVMNENRRDVMRAPQFSYQEVERDAANIVHIKLIRNNAFVTVTDSKGNKKIGSSSGCFSGKILRYSAETTAEHVGRLARNMGLKNFVVKVKGFTFFKKKKQAILSFRDGYTNSRNEQNPIVYIEDTTRLAHNGCRRRKQRRV